MDLSPAAQVSVFFETFLLFRAPLTVSYSLIARVLENCGNAEVEQQVRGEVAELCSRFPVYRHHLVGER